MSVFFDVLSIIFGALIRRELLGSSYIPIITPASKIAMYFASIPSNLKKIFSPPTAVVVERYLGKSGFDGIPNKEEAYLLQ